MKHRFLSALAVTFFALLIAMAISLFVGCIMVSPFDNNPISHKILWDMRMPRILMAAFCGAMLASSGAVMQSVLRNPLSDPYILGTSAGGSLGAAIAIIFSLPFISIPTMAFAGALISVFLVYGISLSNTPSKPETIILAGVAVSSLISAILALMISASSRLQSIYFWMLGSFAYSGWREVYTVGVIALIGIPLIMLFSRRLNIMLIGDEEARSLGVDTAKTRILFLIISALLSGISVAFCGVIGFIGLVVPHIFRIYVGPDNMRLIPLSALGGALLAVIADLVSRTIFMPSEIPVGIITALIGAPFFIWLLRRKSNL